MSLSHQSNDQHDYLTAKLQISSFLFQRYSYLHAMLFSTFQLFLVCSICYFSYSKLKNVTKLKTTHMYINNKRYISVTKVKFNCKICNKYVYTAEDILVVKYRYVMPKVCIFKVKYGYVFMRVCVLLIKYKQIFTKI